MRHEGGEYVFRHASSFEPSGKPAMLILKLLLMSDQKRAQQNLLSSLFFPAMFPGTRPSSVCHALARETSALTLRSDDCRTACSS